MGELGKAILFVLVCLVFAGAGCMDGRSRGRLDVQREAIERGYGELVASELGQPASFKWKEK